MTAPNQAYRGNLIPLPRLPKVLFCAFCGGGTLLLGEDETLWKCLKCGLEFGVAVKLLVADKSS